MSDFISRQAAIDALWKALYEYEDRAEKQFQESEDLDVAEWLQHRIFVQNMSDIDRQTILDLPSADAAPVVRGMRLIDGEWITKGQDIFCSVCGEESAYTWHGSSKFSSYCPNCGAKMEVQE